MVDLAIPTGVKELWLEISDSLGTLGKHAPRHSCGYAYLHHSISRSKNKPPTILINNAKQLEAKPEMGHLWNKGNEHVIFLVTDNGPSSC